MPIRRIKVCKQLERGSPDNIARFSWLVVVIPGGEEKRPNYKKGGVVLAFKETARALTKNRRSPCMEPIQGIEAGVSVSMIFDLAQYFLAPRRSIGW